jgi:Virulence activator alpha C-term
MTHAAGRRHFEDWMSAPTELSAHAIRVEFLTRLFFALALSPASAQNAIDQQIAGTQEGLAQLQMLLDELSPEKIVNCLGLEFRVQQLTGVIAWLDNCKARLSGE